MQVNDKTSHDTWVGLGKEVVVLVKPGWSALSTTISSLVARFFMEKRFRDSRSGLTCYRTVVNPVVCSVQLLKVLWHRYKALFATGLLRISNFKWSPDFFFACYERSGGVWSRRQKKKTITAGFFGLRLQTQLGPSNNRSCQWVSELVFHWDSEVHKLKTLLTLYPLFRRTILSKLAWRPILLLS